MRWWSPFSALATALAAGLACGGSPGHRQIAAGPPLAVAFDGPMTGSVMVSGAPSAHLDAQIGLYDPRPAPGTWMANRTVSDPATADTTGPTWNLQAELSAPDGLKWAGPCGVPRAEAMLPINVMLWGDAATPTLTVMVPLTNDGLVTFQGTAAASGGPLRFVGAWTLDWCHGAGPGDEIAAGSGVVLVDWRLDPGTMRSWPAPHRRMH